ncbi:MAG: hypothetical protein U0Q16_10900 [Bryobacteraceae bacterium]
MPERVAYKDQVNQCQLFSPRVTVAREVTTGAATGAVAAAAPRTPADARAAFDNLFKK